MAQAFSSPSHPAATGPKISYAGNSALLLDTSVGAFDLDQQKRIWHLSQQLAHDPKWGALVETVVGVNNILIVYNPLQMNSTQARDALEISWNATAALDVEGKTFEIEVCYGGDGGYDLKDVATATGLSVEEVIALHSSATYTVAAIGAMPGYPYMVGLPPQLHIPRRENPRVRLEAGSIIIAGEQASIFPQTGPCGWHVIGTATFRCFDPEAEPPCLLQPGDKVKYVPKAATR
jgi:KipI family sensor histidine kinase inhibitor